MTKQIIKRLKEIESRRFEVREVDDISFVVEGFSLGCQGDYMYAHFRCTVNVDDLYHIEYIGDLYMKDKNSKEVYSTYNVSDHVERIITLDRVDELVNFFSNQNLSTIARTFHDWDIEILYD